jgi:hypothetical protein
MEVAREGATMAKKRNLSDAEIGVVKAMLRKGWRNPSSRSALVDRLVGKDSAFRQSTGKAEALRTKLTRGEITAPADVDEDVIFAGAVQALPTTVKLKDLESIRKILLGCLDRAQESDPRSSNRRGAIYRAACRLDELLYSKKK